ncbi:helix-turn-helix domain-containing protein [Streptomyces nigrescens]|uniref:helix-turn-helix domain-containing protein n=1 Tax=Streptomyces nigrescens TaxID=1920 RepID=UPI00346A400C
MSNSSSLITHLRHIDVAMPNFAEQRRFYTELWGLTETAGDTGVSFLAAEGSPEQYVVRLREDAHKRTDPTCSGDHELRGVAAHDFAVGYFASPLDVRVASAEGRRSYFVNIGVSGAISAARGSLRATLDKSTAGVVNPGDSQELRPVRAGGTRFLGLRIDVALLLAQPHSHTAELCDGPPPGHPRTVRAALAFIEANLTEHISLSDIAQAAHCSPRTISSAFRDRLGLSPLSYVRNLLLDRIRKDILVSTDPIGTIAYRWGVSHLGRFASAYRDRFAELPSDTAARR